MIFFQANLIKFHSRFQSVKSVEDHFKTEQYNNVLFCLHLSNHRMKNHLVIVNLFVLLLCVNVSFSTRITDILCTNDVTLDPKRKLICDNNFRYETDRRYYSCFKEIFTDANGASNITLLETRDCRGATLDPKIPDVFKNLFQYSISFHGIESLSPNDLRFNGLQIFDASHNKLTLIPAGLFVHAPLLWEIDLSSNNIMTVEAGAFSELNQVQVLRLTKNPIRRIDGKIFLPIYLQINTFSMSWENIEELDISDMNGVYEFDFGRSHDGIPRRLTFEKAIKTSSFWSYTIRYVSENDLKNLKVFNASGSAVKHIVKIIEILGPSIEVLDVSSNHIGQVNGSAFERFSNIQYLNLSNTNLTSFDLNDLNSRTELKTLDISYNDLNKINFTPAAGSFRNLETLNVIGNKLDNINFATTSNFPKLSNLGNIQNNFV